MSDLPTIANQIRDWQQKRGLSDNELCRKFTGLGSTKTYVRIVKNDLAELDADRWMNDYQQVLTLMQLEDAANPVDEPVIPSLSHMTAARIAVSDALNEKGNNRLVIIEGPYGSGKTTAAREIAATFGKKVVWAEADETWKHSIHTMLSGLLRCFHVPNIPHNVESRKFLLLDRLNATPICLVIDEAHHFGPSTLNIVKSIINQTKTVIVFVASGKLLKNLESEAYEEALQLTKNRLFERVRLVSPPVKDVRAFLVARLGLDGQVLDAAAKKLASDSAMYGNWNFINKVCRRAKAIAGKNPVDLETFSEALNKTIATL